MSETAIETAEATAKAAADEAAAKEATTDETAKAEAAKKADTGGDDWQAKFEAQQKITRDLERKVKGEAGSLKEQVANLQAKLDGKEAEHKAEQEKAATEKAALDKANGRILRSEVKAAAKGVLADPADAYKFLDLEQFEVSEDGEVDEKAITAALEDLVSTKPYLAAQGGKKFQGSGDGGTRKETESSLDDQIAAAQKAGNIQLAIALKQQRAAEIAAK